MHLSHAPAQEAPWPAVVGARVLLGRRAVATVRYVGPVDGQAGTWVGLEYDEPGRGKHDGSHAGRRYFSCSPGAGPAAGSLVRLPKFLEAADGGRPLADAARERYGGAGAPGSSGSADGGGEHGDQQQQQEQQQQQYLTTAGSRRVAVEVSAPAPAARRASAAGAALAVMAGERVSSVVRWPAGMRRLLYPAACCASMTPRKGKAARAQLCPTHCSILCVLQGPAAALRALLPSLAELDLSDNLVASWGFVAELAAALPSLHTLNLSANRLALPSLLEATLAAPPPAAAAAASLAGLQVLVLNGCSLSWEQAVAVGRQLPALRELHLCGNRLSSLALPPAALASSSSGSSSSGGGDAAAAALGGLSLDRGGGGGGGGDASSAAPGGSATSGPPALALTPEEALLAAAFPSLELLDLEGNELGSWGELAALRGLPRLAALLLSGNRLADVRYPGGALGGQRCRMRGARPRAAELAHA